jgi:hypothetical protein
MLDCLSVFFLALDVDLEVDLGADLVSCGGGGGIAEGGSPPPPAAKAGTIGGETINANPNMVSVTNVIADLIMRTSGFRERESTVQPQR